MKLIEESKLKRLLADSERLRRLESGGVYNWNWYYESLRDRRISNKSYNDWIEEDLDNIIDNYESLEHYIEFNYR